MEKLEICNSQMKFKVLRAASSQGLVKYYAL